MKFKHYQTKAKFLTDLGYSKINNDDICYIKDTQEIYTHGQYYKGCLSDYAQNDSTQPDYIKNRTHYVESVSTSDVWYQTNVEVGSASSSPGAYSGTFNLTEGKTYNVTISQGSNTKTYEGIVCENNTTVSGLFLNKNWSNPTGPAQVSSDAFYILVQASSVILASADVYGSGCTVQVSEVTETIHKLDPKYLPDNVNQLDSITTSKSGKVTTVTFEETNGTETQFQVTDGEDGKSAYQVAVDNGYVGTEAQWLASLKGADGVSLGEVELTQETGLSESSVMSQKAVSLLPYLYNDVSIEELTKVYRYTDAINGGCWRTSTTQYGVYIPVKSGENFYIKGNASALTVYFFVKSVYPTITNKYPINFATGSTRIVLTAGQENLVEVPTDANYAWVQTFTTVDTSPDVIKIGETKKTIDNIIKSIQLQEGLICPSNACLELTDDQIECLNESEEITIICVARSFDSSTPNYGYYGGQSNGSVRIVLWHNSILSVSRSNTTNQNNIGSNTYLKDMNMVTINRTTGLCKHYRGTTLVAEKVLTSAVGDNFFVDNKFYFYSGNSNVVYYDFHLYNADITKLIGMLSAYNIVSGVLGVNSIYEGFPTRWDTKTTDTRPTCYNYNKSKVTQSLGNDNKYHYTANTADYIFFCFTDGNKDKLAFKYIWEIEIVSGMMQIAQNKSGRLNWNNTGLNWFDVYDENGVKQEADAEGLIEIGVGNWTLVEYQPGTSALTTSTVKLKGEPFEMIVKQRTQTNIVCAAHIPCNILYDGQLYDDQVEVMYPLYNTNFTAQYSPARSMNKLQVPTTASLPHYPGEIRIADGKVYASTDWNTWKQISN